VRNFLRYGQLVVELGDTPVTVGRAGNCDVVLEDELASREHCRITADGEVVVLVDLDSRNGVLVNGIKVSDSQRIYHGDTITIGTEQLMLMRQQRVPRVTPIATDRRAITAGGEEATKGGDLYELLHGAALRSLHSGDTAVAETSARSLFSSIRAGFARGRGLAPDSIDKAVEIGIVFADKSKEVRWLEQTLDLLTVTRSPMPAEFIGHFTALVREIGRPSRALTEYLRVAREIGATETVRALDAL
jgi:pSer/pThr/pTyr-binding forkhead associated (FHA) protein